MFFKIIVGVFSLLFLVACKPEIDKNSFEYRDQLLINASKSVCKKKKSLDYIAWKELKSSDPDYSLTYSEDGVNKFLYSIDELDIKSYCQNDLLNSYLSILDTDFEKKGIRLYKSGDIVIGKKHFKLDNIVGTVYNEKVPFSYVDDKYYSFIHIQLVNNESFRLLYKNKEDAENVLELLGRKSFFVE